MLARLAEQGIQPEKPAVQRQRGWLADRFVSDPDRYRVEIIESS